MRAGARRRVYIGCPCWLFVLQRIQLPKIKQTKVIVLQSDKTKGRASEGEQL